MMKREELANVPLVQSARNIVAWEEARSKKSAIDSKANKRIRRMLQRLISMSMVYSKCSIQSPSVANIPKNSRSRCSETIQ
jgi:hypothetical protein